MHTCTTGNGPIQVILACDFDGAMHTDHFTLHVASSNRVTALGSLYNLKWLDLNCLSKEPKHHLILVTTFDQ